MHKNGFFHRDMKPENIMCNGTELVKIVSSLGEKHKSIALVAGRFRLGSRDPLKTSLHGLRLHALVSGLIKQSTEYVNEYR